jgi:hypothetical protein
MSSMSAERVAEYGLSRSPPYASVAAAKAGGVEQQLARRELLELPAVKGQAVAKPFMLDCAPLSCCCHLCEKLRSVKAAVPCRHHVVVMYRYTRKADNTAHVQMTIQPLCDTCAVRLGEGEMVGDNDWWCKTAGQARPPKQPKLDRAASAPPGGCT